MMTEDTQRDSVVMYRNQIEALLACSPRDVKLILAMMRDYGMNGSEVDVPEHLVPLWIMFKFSIDETNRKYAEMCEKRRKAAVMGNQQMRANASKRHQTPPNASNSEQTPPNAAYNDNENDNENDISPSNEGDIKNARAQAESTAFKLTDYPKTAEDVLAICKAINSPMTESQAQAYIDQRTVADWHQGLGGSGRKISVNAIPADIRRWVDRDKAEVSRSTAATAEKEAKRNATAGSYGRYVPKH
jgi:hypothetical protein